MKLLFSFLALVATLTTLRAADFALRDGDTLAFLGDSITAARGYTKIVEHYTVMRFPERRVRFINAGQGGVTFRRLDRGLPLNLGIFSALNHRWIPIPETLNGYRLKITGLEPGDYEVRAEGRLLGKYSAARLARGENIASATSNGWEPGGPWDAQSDTVREIIDARDKAWGGEHFRRQFNADHPASAKIQRQAKAADDALITLARTTAKPYPYQFEIRKAAPAKAE